MSNNTEHGSNNSGCVVEETKHGDRKRSMPQSQYASFLKRRGDVQSANSKTFWSILGKEKDLFNEGESVEDIYSRVKSAFENYVQAPLEQPKAKKRKRRGYVDIGPPKVVPEKTDLEKAHSATEETIEDEIVERITVCFGLEADVQVVRKSRFRFDCLFKCPKTGQTHHILIEFKRPTRNFSLDKNTDQVTAYGTDFMAENPSLGRLVLILIDGWSFYEGIMTRKSLTNIKTIFNKQKYDLYTWETGALDESGLKELCKLMTIKPKNIDASFEVEYKGEKSKLVLGKLIGKGGSSCVYDLQSQTPEIFPKEVVIKAVDNADLCDSEIEMNSLLNGFTNSPELYTSKDRYLVFQKCKPVTATIASSEFFNLELRHFGELLEQLMIIHGRTYVHRDVRLANILINDGKAVLGDFGAAALMDVTMAYSGSRETASNRIMKAKIAHNKDNPFGSFMVEFSAEDDYESLFKSFMMWSYPQIQKLVDDANNTVTYLRIWEYYFHLHRPEGMPTGSKEWIDYLKLIFNYTGVVP